MEVKVGSEEIKEGKNWVALVSMSPAAILRFSATAILMEYTVLTA